MSGFRIFTALFAGAVVAVAVYVNARRDLISGGKNRFYPLIAPYFFLLIVALWLILVPLSDWVTGRRTQALWLFFTCFLQIGVYYTLLLLLLPLLRRYISALGISTLWLLPNMLYLSVYFLNNMETRWVIRVEGNLLTVFAVVWACGAAAVLAWFVAGHLRFRRALLRGAAEAPVDALNLLRWEQQELMPKPKRTYKLVISKHTAAPLSIGLFPRTVRIVLPEREYSEAELKLIFRHELIHIKRMDAWTKFFIAVCSAVCWFNPCVWLAMRRVSEDIELGCDEQVLSDADEDARKIYAELILSSTGDGRGFTTNLSSTARALKYRLKHIVNPQKRLAGGVTAGILVVLLILTSGQLSFAYGGGSARDVVFSGQGAGEFLCDTITLKMKSDEGTKYYAPGDTGALTEYLMGLRLYEFTGTIESSEPRMTVEYYAENRAFGVALFDCKLVTYPLDGPYRENSTYYHCETIDWEYLRSLFEDETRSVYYFEPQLMVDFDVPEIEAPIVCGSTILRKTVGGVEMDMSLRDSGSASVVHGLSPTRAELIFTDTPAMSEAVVLTPEYYEVVVEDWDRVDSYTVSAEDMENNGLPLAPYSAHYTVRADFTFGDGEVLTRYEMEYYFDVEFPF